ncbi:MAG: hypothetical protein ACLFNW_13505 [Desulfobacterales bacterium]
MKYVERIVEKLKEKETAEQKFRRLDARIISTLCLTDFFEHLISEMITLFNSPYIWMSIIEDSRLAELVNRVEQSLTLKVRTGFISREDFNRLIPDPQAAAQISDPGTFSPLFPESGIYPVKSMAACPVQIDGETVGCINFGDISSIGLASDTGSGMLAGIMLKISLCLSNVAAHEELELVSRPDTVKDQSGRLYPIDTGRQHNQAKQTA